MPSQKPSLTELAAQLQQALDSARLENERLVQEIEQAEERASAAEARAAEIQQKLSILESLKTKEYQTVVTELFEGPSKSAARLTLVIAIISILIGLAQTIVSNLYAEKTQTKAIAELGESLKERVSEEIEQSEQKSAQMTQSEVQKSQQRTQAEFQKLLRGIPIPGLNDIQKNSSQELVVPHQEERYFRVTIPPDTPKLTVTLTTVTKDADLYVRHLSKPEQAGKSQKEECRSAASGAGVDTCTIQSPREGDWFIRVYGYSGPARAKLLVTF